MSMPVTSNNRRISRLGEKRINSPPIASARLCAAMSADNPVESTKSSSARLKNGDVPHAFPRQIGQLFVELGNSGGIEFAGEHHKGMLRLTLADFGFQYSIARYTKRQRNTNSAYLAASLGGD